MSSSDPTAIVIIRRGRDEPIRKKHHPWVYSQAVHEVRGDVTGMDLVPVANSEGKVLGWGFYSPKSLIAVRLVHFGENRPLESWIEQRIEAAFRLRKALPLDSDAFRLVNAEGDFIPGLILDVYGDTAVASIHVRGIEALSERIVSCLLRLFPGAKFYLKRDEHYGRVEDLQLPSGYLEGNGDGTSEIREGTLRFRVDFAHGQKTGFYLDQRENRRIVQGYSEGRRVMNLFAYTGGFALYAARGGARSVVSVESSRQAVEMAKINVSLNTDLDPGSFQWLQQDVFSLTPHAGGFEMVIVDPPPFARRRSEVEGAIRGYLNVNRYALGLLEPGGYAVSFSCSGAVGRESFRHILTEAALRSGRKVRFLKELHADCDHVVAAEHPEGEYLKGWLIHAE